MTRGFVRHAVQLSDKFGVPRRPAIEVLLTEADAGFKGLIQRSTTFPTGLPLLRASPQLRSAYAELQMLFADHYRILERAELEWDAAQQARDKLKKLVTDDRSNPEWRRQLAISHDQIGDIHARRKQWEQALLEYEASRSISEELLDNWALSFTNYKIGNLLFAQGNHEKALKSFDRAIENLQSLPDDPINIERQQHHLLVLNHRIGDVWLVKCDLKRAYEFYETSLSIAKKLAAHNPDDIQPKLDLSASHDKMGDVLEEQGHLEAALKEYQESLLLTKQLHADDPKKADIKRYLSLGHENVGRILLEQKIRRRRSITIKNHLLFAKNLPMKTNLVLNCKTCC